MSTLEGADSKLLCQTQAKWQAFEKPENKRQMYDSLAQVTLVPEVFREAPLEPWVGLGGLAAIHLSLIFRFFKSLPFHLRLA